MNTLIVSCGKLESNFITFKLQILKFQFKLIEEYQIPLETVSGKRNCSNLTLKQDTFIIEKNIYIVDCKANRQRVSGNKYNASIWPISISLSSRLINNNRKVFNFQNYEIETTNSHQRVPKSNLENAQANLIAKYFKKKQINRRRGSTNPERNPRHTRTAIEDGAMKIELQKNKKK